MHFALGLFFALLQVPFHWTPVLQRGSAPILRHMHMRVPAQSTAKWLIGNNCMLFLGPTAEIEVLPPKPGECARIHYYKGPLRAASIGEHKFVIESSNGETLVQNAVFEAKNSVQLQKYDLWAPSLTRIRYEAQLEIETITGGPRRLSAVLFLFNPTSVDTFSGSLPDIYVAPGEQTIQMQLVRRPTYDVQGEIILETDQTAHIWVQDLSTHVLFPEVQSEPIGNGRHTFTLVGLPQGRFLRLTVQNAEGVTRNFDDCPLRATNDFQQIFSGDFASGTCSVR